MPLWLRLVATAASAALLLAFALAYAGRFVHPREAWLLQLAALTLPLLALALAVSTAGWAVGLVQHPESRLARWSVVLHAAAWLALLARYPPQVVRAAATAPLDARESADLVLLSANVGEPVRGAEDVMRDLLARHRPDVIALQETNVIVQDTLRGASGATMVLLFEPAHVLAVPADFMPSEHAQYFPQPVFSSLLVRATDHVNLNADEDEWRGGRYRRVVLSVGGADVALYNVHLRSFAPLRPWRGARRPWLRAATWREALAAYREDFIARADEAEALARRIEAEKIPVVLAGDLNATADQWVHARLTRVGADVFGGRAGRSATFPSGWPLVRIDHVISGSSWRVLAAARERDGLSDHRPLIVHLRLQIP